MQPKNIKHNLFYIGPYERIIEVGDDQLMIFQESGNVTLCMNPQDHVVKSFGHYDDMPLKDKTKAELPGNTKSDGMDMSVVKGNKIGEMQDIYRGNLISATKIISKEMVKVWMVKSKGLLQVLC